MSEITIATTKEDFRGGEAVEGTIRLDLDQTLPVRGVRVRVEGYEYAHWGPAGRNRVASCEKRALFDEEVTVFGEPTLPFSALMKDAIAGLFSKDNYVFLEPGTHEYAFSYELPEGIPADYESPGRSAIRYELTAYIDVPLKTDLTTSKTLTVYETSAAAPDPEPVRAAQSFDLKGEKLELSAALDRNVFLPGSSTQCAVTVCTESSRSIEGIRAWVRQYEELSASGQRHTNTYDLPGAAHKDVEIAKGEPQDVSLDITLPDELYASISSAKLVNVRYELVVCVDMSWARSVEVRLPIVFVEQPGDPSGQNEELAEGRSFASMMR